MRPLLALPLAPVPSPSLAVLTPVIRRPFAAGAVPGHLEPHQGGLRVRQDDALDDQAAWHSHALSGWRETVGVRFSRAGAAVARHRFRQRAGEHRLRGLEGMCVFSSFFICYV